MERIVTCNGLAKEYGAFPALSGITLSLYGGRVVAVTGDSGSGKTTFLKLMAGLIKPTRGSLLICCDSVNVYSREVTAYLPDRDFLSGKLTPEKATELYKRYFDDLDKAAVLRLLSECNIDIAKPLGRMSRGMRAAVQLVMVLGRQARLYLLDEPFAALDNDMAEILARRARKLADGGACVVETAHKVSELTLPPDDVLLLRSGSVLDYGAAGEVSEDC
ncbi:MAG: ATP-binding cassette domain-containing protein [Ruminococcus sp.]|nr:ATP-binding cassette domain-containing protein [Ruminococcus sp.]